MTYHHITTKKYMTYDIKFSYIMAALQNTIHCYVAHGVLTLLVLQELVRCATFTAR